MSGVRMALLEEQFEYEYDVFLSYNRGERDAGSFFPQHLLDVLNRNGIRSYKYSEDLEEGEEIAPAIDEAIEDSRIAIVILSRHYASSASCLSELVKILEHHNNLIGKRAMPLFYGVEPSCVRRQRESYDEAMVEHESRYGRDSDKVTQWREALNEIAELRGWILAVNRGEADIQRIAGDIGTMLQQLKAPTAPEESPTPKYSKWAVVIGKLMAGLLIFFPSLLLLTSGDAGNANKGTVIVFVSVNVCMYLVAAVAILYNAVTQNTA